MQLLQRPKRRAGREPRPAVLDAPPAALSSRYRQSEDLTDAQKDTEKTQTHRLRILRRRVWGFCQSPARILQAGAGGPVPDQALVREIACDAACPRSSTAGYLPLATVLGATRRRRDSGKTKRFGFAAPLARAARASPRASRANIPPDSRGGAVASYRCRRRHEHWISADSDAEEPLFPPDAAVVETPIRSAVAVDTQRNGVGQIGRIVAPVEIEIHLVTRPANE